MGRGGRRPWQSEDAHRTFGFPEPTRVPVAISGQKGRAWSGQKSYIGEPRVGDSPEKGEEVS